MSNITQEKLDTMLEVIEEILDSTRKNEPYATNFIEVLEATLEMIPRSVEELTQ